jgi:hypothetical protein
MSALGTNCISGSGRSLGADEVGSLMASLPSGYTELGTYVLLTHGPGTLSAISRRAEASARHSAAISL